MLLKRSDNVLMCFHYLWLQHQLECALLGLGQFQNTLDELHTWLSHTADLLQGSRPISIDLQACEIELAKHKVCDLNGSTQCIGINAILKLLTPMGVCV